jgi:hypothetical protein
MDGGHKHDDNVDDEKYVSDLFQDINITFLLLLMEHWIQEHVSENISFHIKIATLLGEIYECIPASCR